MRSDAAEAGLDRHLPFPNVFNFRDLGGYPCADGRPLRWRRLFRADGVQRLTGEQVVSLGIRTVVDLRTNDELSERGRFESEDVTFHHAPVMQNTWEARGILPGDDPAAYLADRYLDMIDSGPAAIGHALRLAADPDATPMVFHCAAGKDRTGVVAAFLLSLLGASDDTVVDDYALSSLATDRLTEWLKREYPDKIAEIEAQPTAFLTSPAPAMRFFIEGVRARWGSFEDCAAAEFGFRAPDIERLRANLLET